MPRRNQQTVLVTWDARIKLLGDGEIWRSVLLVFGIPSVFLVLGAVASAVTRSALGLVAGAGAFGCRPDKFEEVVGILRDRCPEAIFADCRLSTEAPPSGRQPASTV